MLGQPTHTHCTSLHFTSLHFTSSLYEWPHYESGDFSLLAAHHWSVITDSSSLSFHYLAVITQFLITILYHKRLGSHTFFCCFCWRVSGCTWHKGWTHYWVYITSAIDVHKNGLLATCNEGKKKERRKKKGGCW
jgi:hypothetical protein